jgi:hypothetical protein
MAIGGARVGALVGSLAALFACGDARSAKDAAADASTRIAEVAGRVSTGTVDHALAVLPRDSAILSLAHAAGGDGLLYRPTRDTAALHAGSIVGRIQTDTKVVGDTAIEPTHDLRVCRPFTEELLPSSKGGVGNAVVWLVGVETGPVQDAPRRAELELDRCRLEPRVQRVAQGATLMITSRDAMMSRLRFVDVGHESNVRDKTMLNDAGQVVPTSDVAATPGLVEIRDDLHPWVRGYIAVAPHPFVFVTEPDGAFRFEGVPPGSYTLVVWQERLGVRTRALRVTNGVETRVTIAY